MPRVPGKRQSLGYSSSFPALRVVSRQHNFLEVQEFQARVKAVQQESVLTQVAQVMIPAELSSVRAHAYVRFCERKRERS